MFHESLTCSGDPLCNKPNVKYYTQCNGPSYPPLDSIDLTPFPRIADSNVGFVLGEIQSEIEWNKLL